VYEYLEGEVQARTATRLIVDVAGVGYELLVPLGMTFPTSGHARIYTHLTVREDAHTLYGFPDLGRRDLFRVLLSVRGVGPGMALGVLSGLSREELVRAILTEDLAALTRIKGVGKKTGEQILLDLRDKIAKLAPSEALVGIPGALPEGGPPSSSNIEDALSALVSVGYTEKDARKQVERAAKHVDPTDLELLIRTALHG
jgi:Holliday junction DNA helicase RuvA